MDTGTIDSTAVAHAAQSLAATLSGYLTTHLFPGLDPELAQSLSAGIGAALGTLAAVLWGAGVGFMHQSSTIEGQNRIREFWAKYGRWINAFGAAVIAGLASHNVMAAVLPILLHMPAGMVNGFAHVAGKTTLKGVKHAGMSALLLGLLLIPRPSAAGTEEPKVGWGLSSGRYTLAAGVAGYRLADQAASPTAAILARPGVVLTNRLKAEVEFRQPFTHEGRERVQGAGKWGVAVLWIF